MTQQPNQQQPRSSFQALAQAMGVDILRRQEAQIQREISETGQPEWWVRQQAYRAREAERQEQMRLTERRIAEMRDPRLREAREARERAEAQAAHTAWANDPGRLARWRDYVQAHPHVYDALGRIKGEHDPEAPEPWFEYD